MPKLVDPSMPKERGTMGIGALSVLPAFFNLKGKTVLIAGDGEGVKWKVDLLCASGAHVEWHTKMSAELSEKSVVFVSRNWCVSDFIGKTLAVGAFDTLVEAKVFYDAAKQFGLPVNCIDMPKYCDFQFGSIVNRGPVVVSVSTSGAAPILGQVIRQKIETLLPAALTDWAKAAQDLRPSLKQILPTLPARKAFWRSFARTAFLEPAKNISTWLEQSLTEPTSGFVNDTHIGQVTLVGAGPGDAELLTLKAVRALQSADVILFDALVSDDVLELARREAKRMLVGKRGGKKSCKQDDINALMVKLAKQGKRVVRLKSGDPMIFGRAGEEIEILKRHNIPVTIVPGISAAMAAAARLGVSLTHRDCAQGVKFITAHSRKGELPDADWQACADPTTTLMVYMGARTGPLLAQKLMENGLRPDTAVVIAKGISRTDEQIQTVQLSKLCDLVISHDQPVLIGIGQVFKGLLSEQSVNQTDMYRTA